MLAELSRREKEENIKPDPDIDIYQKVSSQIEKQKRTLIFHVGFSSRKMMFTVCANSF